MIAFLLAVGMYVSAPVTPPMPTPPDVEDRCTVEGGCGYITRLQLEEQISKAYLRGRKDGTDDANSVCRNIT